MYLLSNKVKLDDPVLFCEDYRVHVLAILRYLKVIFHANLLHIYIIHKHDLLYKLKPPILFDPLIDEELIWLLLVHDQVLSADDGEILLVVTRRHGDYLVSFSRF